MKKTLLIIGIILIVAGVLALLAGWLFGYAGSHTLDGSADLYAKQRRMMLIFLIVGAIAVIGGIVCLVARRGM